jgi:hypothetical protein
MRRSLSAGENDWVTQLRWYVSAVIEKSEISWHFGAVPPVSSAFEYQKTSCAEIMGARHWAFAGIRRLRVGPSIQQQLRRVPTGSIQ